MLLICIKDANKAVGLFFFNDLCHIQIMI